jgi:hypothetical protein
MMTEMRSIVGARCLERGPGATRARGLLPGAARGQRRPAPRSITDFPEETIGAEHGPEFGAEELEGDGAFVLEIAGEPDGGHAATAELVLERVAIGQGRRELCESLGQRALSGRDIPRL